MTSEKLPPQDVEAEASCLASMLLSKEALLKTIGILRPEDFYLDGHRRIFETIIDLDKRNIPVDLITLKERLKDLGHFDKVGGDRGLAEMYQITAHSANAEYYANRVKELSLRRKFIDVAAESIEHCYDRSRDTQELMDEIERNIFLVTEKRITSDFNNIYDVLNETLANIIKMKEEKRAVTGVAGGFTDLDNILTGFHGSELLIIAARPSMGKTAFALNIANHIVLKEKKPVLFHSLEMPATQLAMRLLCIESGVDSQRVRTGHISGDELKRIAAAAEKLGQSPLFIDDTPAINIFELRAKARRVAQREKLGMIIVDYLQLMSSPSRLERHLQIAEISRSLKQLSRDLDVPVIALSQLSRAVESRTDQRPQLSDLRESGAIEQDADVVLFLYREEKVKRDTTRKGYADIIIAKQRNGPTGTVELMFLERCTKFGNLDKQHDYEGAVQE
ncbi:MAG TPA: replicative DNA helicase [Spirochaetota bacterium]|jgi:replicative DNA helicase|nr:replicative DNA helicase [Spirochaetota bacterium]